MRLALGSTFFHSDSLKWIRLGESLEHEHLLILGIKLRSSVLQADPGGVGSSSALC